VYWQVQDTSEDIERIEVIRGRRNDLGRERRQWRHKYITKNSKDTHETLVSMSGGNVVQGIEWKSAWEDKRRRLEYV